MADNVKYTEPGSGTTFATDDVAGVHFQKIKLFDGTADSTTAIVAGNGTEAGALRVTLASDSTGVVAATQSGTWNLNNISGTISLPTGAATESTLSTLNSKVTACNTGAVTISAALPAGTNAIGKLSANDGVDIGDVTINNASIAVTGTFWQATQPVSIASVPSHDVTNAGTFPVQAAGDVAHDVGDSGSPVKVGGRADTVRDFATAVAAGDRCNFATDLYGRQKVAIYPDDVKRLGVYYYHSGALTVNAAADSAATSGGGRVWIQNPTGSSVTMRIRRIIFRSQLGSALAAVTSPRFTIEKCVFTGTASGASITAAKRRTSDATAGGSGRTAVTGMTISSAAVVCSFFPVASATAVAYCPPTEQVFDAGLEDYIDLAAGELLVLRQADAGTTSDTRRLTCDFIVEEF